MSRVDETSLIERRKSVLDRMGPGMDFPEGWTRDLFGQPHRLQPSLPHVSQWPTTVPPRVARTRVSRGHLAVAQRISASGSAEIDLVSGSAIWTEELFHITGRPVSDFAPTLASFLSQIHADDRDRVKEIVLAEVGGRKHPPCEFRLLRPDGEMRWLRRHSELFHDGVGNAVTLVEAYLDLTDRIRLETALRDSDEALRRSEEHLQRAQRAAGIGSVEEDLLTGAQFWSDEFYRLLGLRPGEVAATQENFMACIHPEDRARLGDRLAGSSKADDDVRTDEFQIQLADGAIRWLFRRAEVERDERGKAIRVLCTYRDVTERRHMQSALVAYADELRTSREHLMRAQRAGRVGSAEFDLRSSTIIWSDELRRILGIGPEVEPSVEAYLSAIHPEDRDRMRVAAKKVLAGQFEGPTTFRVLRGDGEVRWIHRVNEMVRDGRGMPISIITTIIDVTEARRSEEERTRLQEQLAHAQKLESLGALSGGIAHDFNNLLTSIMGSAALLRDDPTLSPAARELTEIVIKASGQGAELTRRLLSFGRRQMLKPVVIDLAMVARELESILRRTLGENLSIAIRPAADLWMAKADRSQFESAIINLAINARDAMPDGGELAIEMTNQTVDDRYIATHAGAVRGDYVAIAVRDTGTGMASEVLKHAFEPFFTTKQEGQGTGLGLAMVYGFAKQSGGYTKIESTPGKGTCVTLLLPRSTDAPPAPATRRDLAKSIGGSESILLVEDDAMVRDFVAMALGRLGYRVEAVADARAAVNHLANARAKIDLLLTDLMLPDGMNGGQLAVEAALLRPGLRVLFASGYTEDTLIRDGQLEPGQLLIAKPFDSKQLAGKVREALDG
jgi:PAS domain S-box-containing protein